MLLSYGGKSSTLFYGYKTVDSIVEDIWNMYTSMMADKDFFFPLFLFCSRKTYKWRKKLEVDHQVNYRDAVLEYVLHGGSGFQVVEVNLLFNQRPPFRLGAIC